MNNEAAGNFPSTDWTLIARLRSRHEDVAHLALDELCGKYHYPLYCFIRRRGLDHHDAQDALHDFLAKLLRNESLKSTQRESGKLRGFLSTALQRFLANWHRDHAKERLNVSIEAQQELERSEERFQREKLTDEDTPERVFERKWAQELLRRVLAEIEAEYERKNKLSIFQALRPVVLAGGSLVGEDTDGLALSLGMSSATLRVAMSRFLGDYRDRLRREVLQTLANPDEIDEELASLANAFQKRSHIRDGP
jgi:RNA polymerase sigma-70 factor (ECF subfamily)